MNYENFALNSDIDIHDPYHDARLNPLSEMMVLSTGANTKNIIVSAVEVHGKLDLDAMREAFKRTLINNPLFLSKIEEKRFGIKNFFIRHYDSSIDPPVRVIKVDSSTNKSTILNSYLEAFRPYLDRKWNLFSEAPVELHCLDYGSDNYFYGPVVHHAIADGGIAAEFGREFLGHYDHIITGRMPEWLHSPFAMSNTGTKRAVLKARDSQTILADFRTAIKNIVENPTLPRGSGKKDDLRQFHIKRVLTKRETEALERYSKQRSSSLLDIVVASSNHAIDQWNCKREIPEGFLTTSVSVNMKGRFRGFQRQNNSGLIYFRSGADERQNRDLFRKQIALQRIKQFRNRMDYKFFKDVSRLITALRMAPLEIRKNIVRKLMNLHRFSMAVSMLGVMWPDLKDGRPTSRSAFTNVGEHEIMQVHGLGYKLLSNTPLILMVYTYRERLNLMLASSASVFTSEETSDFLDLLVNNLFHEIDMS